MAKRPPLDPTKSYRFVPTSTVRTKAFDPAKSHRLVPTATERMKPSSFRLDASTVERLDKVAAAYAALALPVSRGAILRQAVDLGLDAVELRLRAFTKKT